MAFNNGLKASTTMLNAVANDLRIRSSLTQ